MIHENKLGLKNPSTSIIRVQWKQIYCIYFGEIILPGRKERKQYFTEKEEKDEYRINGKIFKNGNNFPSQKLVYKT